MAQEHRLAIDALLEQLESIPPHQQEGWLKQQCGGNEALFQQVKQAFHQEQQATVAAEGRTEKSTANPQPMLGDLAGLELGSWRLLRPLGSGGMGEVWLAERADAEFSMLAAVKLIKKDLATEKDVARFRRERQLLADLKHPHIAVLHDGGRTPNGDPYLVMEYVSGLTLGHWYAQKQPGVGALLGKFRQLCLAVAYAHRKGVLHRDIKPANVMVDDHGLIKLMDFGIAASQDEPNDGSSSPMTPEYASPERLRGEDAAACADIYSLGLMLTHLLSQLPPHQIRNNVALVLDQLPTDKGRFDELRPLLRHMLAEDTEHRIASMDAVLHELDNLRGAMFWDKPEDDRKQITFDAVILYPPGCADEVERIARRLEDEQKLHLWLDHWHTTPNDPPEEAFQSALTHSAALLVVVTPNTRYPWRNTRLRNSLQRASGTWRQRVVPILLSGARRPQQESDLPPFLRRRQWLKLQHPPLDSLDEISRALRGLSPHKTTEKTQTAICPFRGLEVFREEDACFFFGREALVGRLQEHMQQHNFLAVLGPSGTGKSSLVQAGLTPGLVASGRQIALLTPTTNPLEELAFALNRLVPKWRTAKECLELLKASDSALANFLGEWAELGIEKPCVIIDQLEELFTLVGKREDANRFVNNLMGALAFPENGFSLIVTLRSDFLGQCVTWPDLATYCSEKMILVDPMERSELSRAMTEPAALVGLVWERGLPEKILDDVADGRGELPLLEHALLELYQRRRGRMLTLAAYMEIGGIEGALARRAESIFKSLNEEGQGIIRKMFTLCLVHPGEGTEDTRRRATRAEILAVGEDQGLVSQLLDHFIEARLLTGKQDEERHLEQVDVSHEALIRKWHRIKSWMAEDRETARLLAGLRQKAKQWEEAGHGEDFLPRGGQLYQMRELCDREGKHLGENEQVFVAAAIALEEREATRKRWIRNWMAILAMAAMILAAFSFRASLDAKDAKTEAVQAKQRAEQKTLEANYHLAIAYNEKVGIALEEGRPQEAFLGAFAALSLDIPEGMQLPQARGRFLDHRMAEIERLLWTSPTASKLNAAAISSDDTTLALAGVDMLVRLIDVKSGMQTGLLTQASNGITQLVFSPDNQWLAAATDRDHLYLWHLPTQEFSSFTDGHRGTEGRANFSPDGRWLASVGNQGKVIWRDMARRDTPSSLQLSGTILDIAQSNSHLYVATSEGLYMVERLAGKFSALDTENHPLTLTWSEDRLAIGWKNGRVSTYYNGRLDEPYKGLRHNGPVLSMTRSRGGWISSCKEKVLHWDDGPGPLAELRDLVSLDVGQDILVGIRKNGQLASYDLKQRKSLATPAGHADGIWGVAFLPDGQSFASSSFDGTVQIWDRLGQRPPQILPNIGASRTYRIVVSDDGNYLAAACEDGLVRLWHLHDAMRKPWLIKGHDQAVWSVAISPNSRQMATAGADQVIRIWKLPEPGTSGEPILTQKLQGHTLPVFDLTYNPAGTLLASASSDQTVRLWPANGPDTFAENASVLRGHTASVWGVDISPDGQYIASASHDLTVRIWPLPGANAPTNPPLILRGHEARVWSVAFSPDGRQVASCSDDKTVRLYTLPQPDGPPSVTVEKFEGHMGPVFDIAFAPEGDVLVSACHDQTLKMWQTRIKDAPLDALVGHKASVWGVSFSPDGQYAVSSSSDLTARVWSPGLRGPDGERLKEPLVQELRGHTASVYSNAFSPDGRLLATSSDDHTIRIWSVPQSAGERFQLAQVLKGHEAYAFGVSFSPDGRLLASASEDQTARIWGLDALGEKEVPVAELKGHQNALMGAVFSPNGRLLATSSNDSTARIWRVPQPEQLQSASISAATILEGHSDTVYGISFSPDGNRLATASHDHTLRIWSIHPEDGTLITPIPDILRGHKDSVYGAVYAPNGRYLASTSADHTVHIWNAQTHEIDLVLQGHGGEVNWFPDFSPDSQILATPSDDQTVRLWHMKRRVIPPDGIEPKAWYRDLLSRALYYLSYRREGFQLQETPRMRIFPKNPTHHPLQHLDKPRPPQIPTIHWLMHTRP